MVVLHPQLVNEDDRWAPRYKLKELKEALDKIQRMVLGDVAEYKRITPLTARETLLGLPSLEL